MNSVVENIDCMIGMARYPDKHFELAIVDPPYGIGETAKRAKGRVTIKYNERWPNRKAPEYKGNDTWDDKIPDEKYFLELKRVSKNIIIWGGNYFSHFLPASSGWIVWYKKRFNEINDFSDAELAFSSFAKGCRLFHLPWIGFGAVNVGENRTHPTQKPVKLYKWLLKNYAQPGDKILDTHLGSGSSRIAAHSMGFDFTGFEIDKDYFEAQEKRFNDYKKQLVLF